ncbi:MAG: DHHC zinc finger domain-containing protein, partial [Armatimonadetes bacterium]|nr:DHHC zinc finger domain-containing protein [Armatimonadota bacterium]
MLCWECRKPNPDRAKYCASCGVKLEGAPEAVASPAQEEAGADAPGHDDCL